MRALHSLLLACGLTLLAPDAAAQQHPATNQTVAATDLVQIHGFMQKTWHSAEHPLKLGPTHISGDFAVADWWHQGKGGRAVFKRSQQHWQLILCGGAGILQSALWQHLGLTPAAADDFVRAISRAEQSVSASDKALLDAFGATIKLQSGHGPQY
jgi:hypothetical protein